MISETLKMETAHHHEAIENAKRFSRLGSEDFSREEYIGILEKFYGFYKPLERAFREYPEVMEALRYEQRFKLPLLERDLAFLGHSSEEIAQLPECADLPPTRTKAEVLGCVYVMEGSTHGSQFIAKRLRSQFNLDGQGVVFYEGYGKDTMSQWKEFKTYLDSAVNKETVEGQQVVDAAAKTFEALHRWMDQ